MADIRAFFTKKHLKDPIPAQNEIEETSPVPLPGQNPEVHLDLEEEKIEPSPSKRRDLPCEKREFSEITGCGGGMILEIQSESASHTRPAVKRFKRVVESESEGSKDEVSLVKQGNSKMLHYFAKKQPASPTQKRVVRREAK